MKANVWCQIKIQLQQLHIGEQKLLGHLKRVYDIPTIGHHYLKLDFINYEFKWDDEVVHKLGGHTRTIRWRKK